MVTDPYGLELPGRAAKFDGTNWIVYNTSNSGLPNDFISSLAIDNNGNIWIGSAGLDESDGTGWSTYTISNSGLPDNYVRSIAIDENGWKWLGTGSRGVAVFMGTEAPFTKADNVLKEDNTKTSPNPVENFLNHETTSYLNNFYVELFGIQGNLIKSYTIDNTNMTLDMSDLANGIYLLKLHIDNTSIIKKLIKH